MVSHPAGDMLFEVATPLGFHARVTRGRWEAIVNIKHPVMVGREGLVQAALSEPDEIRISRTDPDVYLFYKRESTRRWVCAVAKRLEDYGFLITAYPTDAIKAGNRVWPTSKSSTTKWVEH